MNKIKIVALLLTSSLLIGCNSTNKTSIKESENTNTTTDKNISISIDKKNIILDPAYATTTFDKNIVAQLFDTLTYINAAKHDVSPLSTLEFKPNANFTKWQFELRDDLYFSNGEKINASDFVNSFMRILKDKNNPNAKRLFFITGARDFNSGKDTKVDITSNGNILTIGCEYPKTDVAEILAQPCFAVTKNTTFDKDIVTSGAYKIASFEKGKKLSLIRNDKYWDNTNTRIDKITFNYVKDYNLAYNLVQQDIDTIFGEPFYDIPREYIDTIKNSPNKLSYKINSVYMCIPNQKKRLDNVHLRHAFMYAMDRHSLISLYNTGTEDSLTSMYADNKFNDYDTVIAKKELASSKLDIKSTKKDPFVLLTDNNPGNLDLAKFIAGNWNRALGVDMKIRMVDEKDLYKAMLDNNYDFCLYKYDANTNNPDDTFNFTYKNELLTLSDSYISTLEKALSANSEQDKLDLYKKLDAINVNDVNFIPIYRDSNLVTLKENIKFFNINNIGITYLRDLN